MSHSEQTTSLAGKRVLITRAAEKAASLAAHLQALGAEPIVAPMIAHAPPSDPAQLQAAIERLSAGAYDWLILTSVTTVTALLKATIAPSCQIAAVGPQTARACRERFDREPTTMPTTFTAAALAKSLGDLSGQRVLLPCADLADPRLEADLRAAGANLERVIAYRTVPAEPTIDLAELLADGALDAITFTSGSTARFFFARLSDAERSRLADCPLICIGPSTAAVVREHGFTPTIANVATEAGLVEALIAYFAPSVPSAQMVRR